MQYRPVRIQLSRAKGWRMPPNTVKVDRSTRWGNPWKVWQGSWWFAENWRTGQRFRCGNREGAVLRAIEEFRRDAPSLPVEDLRGKNLACWCKLGEHCHADVLLELANR